MSNDAGFAGQTSHDPTPLEHLANLMPLVDLTEAARNCPSCSCTIEPHESHTLLERIGRRLSRSHAPHVLLTGNKGIGKSTIVEQLARRAAASLATALSNARFLWIDCSNVGVEDSRACLESIFTVISQMEDEIVLCLDGMVALLKRANGGTNKPLLRAMIARPGLRLIGIMSEWEYSEQIGSDAAMLDCFTRIQIEEPNEQTALEIARHHAARLAREFDLRIHDRVVERTIALTSTFVLNERHPAKSVRILRQVCEDAQFDRIQLGQVRDSIELPHIVSAIAEKTGIPAETIVGEKGGDDFEAALRDAVVGQDQAVAQVANELRLIKAGLAEPGKPAAVLLFAGMTGVGKTELAKRIAELYSSSKRLQIYTMGNFTEAHSVSGIIGVPPGYVGHEDGGRLINELNADPYSVFLLDEAEKCHPNIWKPFLNLFDEGWIVDQRGTKAFADRAIIILTTNAGDRNVAQMSKSGASPEAIAERVKQALSKVRQERSTQPVFPPQFLARIRRIIVFAALDESAMVGIAERCIRRMKQAWLQKREKHLEIHPSVIARIGRLAHEQNERANGEEGGRIVKKLISDLIEGRIQAASLHDPAAYTDCSRIKVEWLDAAGGGQATDLANIRVIFCSNAAAATASQHDATVTRASSAAISSVATESTES